jgi:hypothetical protein
VIPRALMVHDRENREKPEAELYSDAYFLLQERRIKVKYANVNTFQKNNLTLFRKKISNQLLKALIKQNRTEIKANRTYLKLIDKITLEIEISVKKNQVKQSNYLEL